MGHRRPAITTVSAKKRHGVHYTPSVLADFLARRTVAALPASAPDNHTIRVLDPACGDGELLVALTAALRAAGFARDQIIVCGFDQDPAAVETAQQRIAELNVGRSEILAANFLETFEHLEGYDCIISNPPYVRTQVMGGPQAQRLAKQFGLKGRVDLYQIFTAAILQCLAPNAAVGLLTSNRFLTVKAGASMRKMLRQRLDLNQIFDLGDSQLFDAAVLPVIFTGNKLDAQSASDQTKPTEFCRIYRSDSEDAGTKCLLDLIEQTTQTGTVSTRQGNFEVQRGFLTGDDVWQLTNARSQRWLKRIEKHRCYRFSDVAEIKVGIKTTADKVFIGHDWPEGMELLQPLLTHHIAGRWRCETPEKQVLYPYDLTAAARTTVRLKDYPKAAAYLKSHRQQLAGRKYLIDAKRHWYEIWVAQQPSAWKQPKVVWPDISEHPKFFLDTSGAVVNGDCYWLLLRNGFEEDWLYLILAIANSEIATQYYDTVFCNKLYARRRRFMTQYVADFPLPDIKSKLAQAVVAEAKKLVKGQADDGSLNGMVKQLMLGK